MKSRTLSFGARQEPAPHGERYGSDEGWSHLYEVARRAQSGGANYAENVLGVERVAFCFNALARFAFSLSAY